MTGESNQTTLPPRVDGIDDRRARCNVAMRVDELDDAIQRRAHNSEVLSLVAAVDALLELAATLNFEELSEILRPAFRRGHAYIDGR